MKLWSCFAAVFLTLIAAPAYAHIGVHATLGFSAGVAHPLGGLDHVLAMVAVGILAAQSGTRTLWPVPLAFVLMMVVGAIFGITGMNMPFVEVGIVGSVVILGLVIAVGKQMSVFGAVAMVGLLALFHGNAHGTEMIASYSGIIYGLGFVLSTVLLHLVGIVIGVGARMLPSLNTAVALRISGGVITLAGLGLMLA